MSTSETITRTDLANILNEVLPNTSVDYIVEQGTSGIWTYRKWNSGNLEAWGYDSQSWANTTALASHYYGQKSYTISALGFTAISNIQVTGEAKGYYIATKVEEQSTSTIKLTALSAASDTRTIVHSIYIKGTWK